MHTLNVAGTGKGGFAVEIKQAVSILLPPPALTLTEQDSLKAVAQEEDSFPTKNKRLTVDSLLPELV